MACTIQSKLRLLDLIKSKNLAYIHYLLSNNLANKEFIYYVFFAAAEYNQFNIVRHLLNYFNIDPSKKNNRAIKATNNQKIKLLLIKDERVYSTINKQAFFINSIKSNNSELSSFLLSCKNFNPSYQNNKALRKATEIGDLSIVEKLMSYDSVLPLDKGLEDRSAFESAIYYFKDSILDLFISSNKAKLSIEHNYLLSFACERKNLYAFKLLLKIQSISPAFNNNHCLHIAAYLGQIDFVRLLLLDERIHLQKSNKSDILDTLKDGLFDLIQLLSLDIVYSEHPFSLISLISREKCKEEDLLILKVLCTSYSIRNGDYNLVSALLSDKRLDFKKKEIHFILQSIHRGDINIAKILIQDHRFQKFKYRINPILSAKKRDRFEIVDLLWNNVYLRENLKYTNLDIYNELLAKSTQNKLSLF